MNMDEFQLNQVLYKLLSEYRDNHIYCFFASNLFKHLTPLNKEQKKQIIKLLVDYVEKGILSQHYVIFNPHNPRERKVYNSIDKIPVGEEIEFDFCNVYISSINDPQIKVFYEIVDKTKKKPKVEIKEESSFFSFNDRESCNKFDSLSMQVTIINKMEEPKVTENNFNISNSNINQVGGTINNNDSNIVFNKPLSQTEIKAIMDLQKTNNEQVNAEIEKMKKSAKEKNKDNVIKYLRNIKEIYSTINTVLPGTISMLCSMFGL